MTIIVPMWFMYLLSVVATLSAVKILLDFYIYFLRAKIKKLLKKQTP